eukprot:Nk52_evm51s270 gene=Nk52_evmTU51s270
MIVSSARFPTVVRSTLALPVWTIGKLVIPTAVSASLFSKRHLFSDFGSVINNTNVFSKCAYCFYDREFVRLYSGVERTRRSSEMRWNITAQEIRDQANDEIIRAGKTLDKLGSLPEESVDTDTFLEPLTVLWEEYGNVAKFLQFPQHCFTDKATREASVKVSQDMQKFEIEAGMRRDLYEKFLIMQRLVEQHPDDFSDEQKRMVKFSIRDLRRNGMELTREADKEKLKTIKNRISELEIQFSNNLNEDTTTLLFKKDDITGMPEGFVDSLEKSGDDEVKVTLQYPHVLPILKNCNNSSVRKAVDKAYNSKCQESNIPILEELVKLRHEAANLLGYKNHAEFVTEVRMAKTPEAVASFLNDLASKMTGIYEKEYERLLKYKQEDVPGAEALDHWDFGYYLEMVEKKCYGVNNTEVKQYFEADRVVEKTLSIYQKLLSLRFENVTADAKTWHEEVSLFKVYDKNSNEFFGEFYLDLHPREGKYGHAAVFPLRNGFERSGKHARKQSGTVAMLCNFSKATKDKPALLLHSEVVTFFHEFGHVMHALCSKPKYDQFTGFGVEQDFVEAPSQMLENWCFESESLKMLSAHYSDDSKPLPDDLIKNIKRSEKANVGYFTLRQIVLAKYDQELHTGPSKSLFGTYDDLNKQLLKRSEIEGTNFAGTFGHLAGYDASYYGYMWSKVYAEDMFFSRFKKIGVLSETVGLDYREKILKPGSSLDAMDLLKEFLEREPTTDAFFQKMQETDDEVVCN